jgi:two-component system CheB/CheR fusion protein
MSLSLLDAGVEPRPASFRIVGVGASAGGLESLEALFDALPANPGMAFVVIQHLSPDFRSMMDELLARHCRMPIRVAEHEMRVEVDHVYLLPAGKEMIIRDGRLLLTEKDRGQSLPLPIDQFFRSLAADCGAGAMGVILSGSGSDGSRGVREIRNAGGLVFVESPETAKFDGMPISALASGAAAQAAPPREIAALLVAAREWPVAPPPSEPPDRSPMAGILRLLRDQFGLDFSQYKTGTVTRRVLRRLEMGDLPGPEAYLERLRHDADELGRLYHDLLIGVTRFFRDPQAFAILEQEVVPDIIAKTPSDQEIRVWVAGCATGEEAYSIAMLFIEQLAAARRPLNLKVLATDVHRASLAQASAGLYDEDQLEHVSDERRDRFFTLRARRFAVSAQLRQHVVFAPHNITKDAPFTKMHLISCRNLLIYLEPPAQKLVLSLFHFGLATGGTLFLGSSETPGDLLGEFTPVDEHWRIYRKRRDVRLIAPDRLHVRNPSAAPTAPATARLASDAQLMGIYDQLLTRVMPPSLRVDVDRALIDSFGGAERYLRMRARRPSVSILDLLTDELRTVVAAAIHHALNHPDRVRYDGVAVTDDDGPARATVSAEAFRNSRTQARFVLVSIERESAPAALPPDVETAGQSPAAVSSERVALLETELMQTRERLQATIEELQTSNEELQATNEELIASNEELQSTNEELHSVNEELYTVNAEHQRKIVELRELNSDMQHLLEAGDVGMLFLDGDLRVRRYTPRIAPLFHLEPTDVGRSIRHFSHALLRPELFGDIERTLTEGAIVETEVAGLDGTPYLLRILPYQPIRPAQDEAPDRGRAIGEGVVLSLTDITALVRAQDRARYLSLIVESSDDAIVGLTLDGTITSWNAGATRLYGYTGGDAIGENIRMLAPPDAAAEIDRVLADVASGVPVDPFETLRRRQDGSDVDVSVSISAVRDRSGHVVGAAAIARDITDLRETERALAAREARIRLLLDSTAEAIYGVDLDGCCMFCNAACARLLGYETTAELIGRPIEQIVPHAGASGEHPARRVLATGEAHHADGDVLVGAAGRTFPVEYWGYPIRGPRGVIGAVVTFIDVTERKRAETEAREASRRREQFLAMLSHELRNPLAAITSATQVLRCSGMDEAAASHARDIIARQSDHMSRLLDDLLDVARITRGGIDLRRSPIDLRSPIQLALEASTPLLQSRRMQVTVDLPATPLPVFGDAARLQQVVGNLLSNAARHSDGGAMVSIIARAIEGTVELRVRDTGRGIDPAMLEAIFDLFVQGAHGLDRRGAGLGVGLTLVRQIVELHGGTVTAHSEGPNTGSEFVVRLPVYTGTADVTGPAPHSAVPPGGARRVVVAEDQADAREMLRLLLEAQGHVVFEAPDGPSALALIEQCRPDVAIVDIGLPLMDGYDIARRLRGQPELAHVRLLALTGYGTAEDVAQAYAAGFDEHVTKPPDFDSLSAKIAGTSTPHARAALPPA